METITRIRTLRERVSDWRQLGLTVGFVPTMGNLHQGHMSLITEARRRCDRVIVSIFVNPSQFGPSEDYALYPRTPQEDSELLDLAVVDLLFHPDVEEMYPGGHARGAVVDVPQLSGILCGAFRPGHFVGVATVVTKLLGIVQPHVAVFGEKDYQQLSIVKRVVEDLCLPVEIVGAPTLREPDGLAMSSRNRYLTPAEREIAPRLHRALVGAQQRIEGGDRNFEAIQQSGMRALEAAGFVPQYFAVVQADDLQPPGDQARELVILAAARLGKARLIDNVRVTRPQS
ncbi:MAG TPA: pantoate--beta-alanine ligase [Steroidobacteraceae bacterium]|nr:pantoate--beta-alanine ligase [Steroidobacteraceae bacterium]